MISKLLVSSLKISQHELAEVGLKEGEHEVGEKIATEAVGDLVEVTLQHEIAKVCLEEGEREVGNKIATHAVEDPEVKVLQQKFAELCEEVKKLKYLMERKVALDALNFYCDIALIVEQAICSTVLPEIFTNDF